MLKPGTLWDKLRSQTKYAYECGALQSISTEYERIEQNGIRFFVRIITNIIRKEEAKQKQQQAAEAGVEFDPFLPYEEDLFIADLSETHLCLLNKYNVVDHHLLIVTRAFEEQDNLLTFPDFIALWRCLVEIDGLGFYNGGEAAGASQRHKHLQLLPFPLIPDGTSLPIADVLATADFDRGIGTVPNFPFQHGLIRLNWQANALAETMAQQSLEAYHQLLKTLNIKGKQGLTGQQTQAYNLLITREWILIVPRSQHIYENIQVNSLGIGGAMLVRNREQLEHLKKISPFKVLTGVTVEKTEE
ncbi:MAG: phosphorylase [Microcoleaceae cyanobacterium]